MRTTIDIPDKLFRRVKAYIALRGISLKDFITRSIQKEIGDKSHLRASKRIKLPIVLAKNPHSINLTSEKISAILENEDLHVSS